ncbi:MAG: DUF5348 domain-containing protein [Lachnospiraceae bacterium]|nr:DUF5348 domain-containing protein [Lachnospiraceae bacterium]
MADINKVFEEANKLKWDIESLLKLSAFEQNGDLSGLHIDEEDSNELFLVNELQWIMYKLEEAKNRIAYLKRPVKETSHLHKNAGGRYETSSGHVYTSGDIIEVLLLGDNFHETPYWVRTSVEHNGRDYYLVNYKDIGMEGLAVRRR